MQPRAPELKARLISARAGAKPARASITILESKEKPLTCFQACATRDICRQSCRDKSAVAGHPPHRTGPETPPLQPHNRHPMDGSRMRARDAAIQPNRRRSEEHTSELQSLMRISYAVFCLKKK